MSDLAAKLLSRLIGLLAALERQPDPIAIPVRRDDGRDPRRAGRRT